MLAGSQAARRPPCKMCSDSYMAMERGWDSVSGHNSTVGLPDASHALGFKAQS